MLQEDKIPKIFISYASTERNCCCQNKYQMKKSSFLMRYVKSTKSLLDIWRQIKTIFIT